ncbi:MAG TPA: hypothetical protein VMZ90_09330 [Vicinamibacterales bacterium]|nr:hypothetical protein [Vicinamibacterales bacterium]
MGMEAGLLKRFWIVVAIVVGTGMTGTASAPVPAFSSMEQSDLDAFMKKVVAKRDDNWKKFQQYVLDEREQVEFRGPGKIPLWGDRRDYTWYVRDGYFVRSPVKANGVTLSEEERRSYEKRFVQREQNREKRAQAREKEAALKKGEEPVVVPVDDESLLKQSREPEFISSAYFLKFKFEEGKYAFAGKETIDGRELLKVEYYPKMLFSKEQNSRAHRREMGQKTKDDNYDAQLEQMLNKVSVVTLWIEPSAFQIVKYNFQNVNLDFLPGAWMVRLTDARAMMMMHQPFPDVWLPKDVDFYFAAMLAVGEMDARYRINYTNYKLATATAKIK